MSTIAPPPLPPNPALVNSEGYIDEQIRRTRRALKLLDLGAGVLTLTIGLLAFVLVGALLDHWIIPGGLNVAGRATLFLLMLAGLAWYGWRQFIPLLKPINPVYAAQTIEQNAPTLKNSLLNLLLFRSHRNYLSARVYHALEQQTAAKLSKATLDASIDRSALLRLGYALLAIITVCALYALLSPKSLGLSTVRVLAPWSEMTAPSRVQIRDVKPGDLSVARGERVEISAEVNGLGSDEQVRLRYSTADEQTVDESIRMERPTPQARRFVGFLPRGADSGVMQDLTYWLEAGDARTEKFKLSVFERPTIVVQKVHYNYPRYTGLPAKESVQNGDLKGLDGTEVTISALASRPIKSAAIDFEADGTSDLTMTTDGDRATAKFKLQLRDGSPTPLHPKYALRFTAEDGRTNSDPTVHSIEVTRDLPPEIEINDPQEAEQVARVSDLLTIGVEARDPDYGLKRVAIVGKVNDGGEQPFFELLNQVHTGRFGAIKSYTPGELGLKPGDVLEYWGVAEDSRPEPNVAFTDHRRLKIIGPDKPQNGKQPPQNGGQQQPDKQEGGENGEQGGQGGASGGQGGESGGEGEAQSGAGGSGGSGEGESGESKGQDQEGQGGSGSGSGENESGESQEPSDEAGENGSGGSGGEGDESTEGESSQGNSQGNRSGQSGGQDQQSQDGESQPGESGEQGDGSDQQSGGGEQSKVASGGEDDGTAFQRMAEHMNQQDGAGEGKPDPSQQAGEGEQASGAQASENAGEQGQPNEKAQGGKQDAQKTNGQGGQQQKPPAGAAGQQQEGAKADQAQDAAGQMNEGEQNGASPEQASTGAAQGSQKGSNQKPQADGAQPPGPNEKATDANQQSGSAGDNPSQREGANKPEEAKPGDGNPENQQSGQEPSPDSEMNRNDGNSGAGHGDNKQEGAPGDDQSMRQGRDKQQQDNQPGQDDSEPASGAGSKKESDSQGGQSGDQAGGGKQGGGQQADAAGKGGPGQHEAADQGAGKAQEQGEGQTGTKAGDQQQADGQTGQSSGDQPGNGSQQGETGQDQPSDGGQQPGEQGGESPSAGGQGQGMGQNRSGQSGEQQPQPGEQPGGEQPQGGQQPGSQQSSAESNSDGQQPGDPAANQSPNNATGNGGSQPIGGGTGSNAMSSPSTESGQLGADDPNLDYAKKQTDLVLERLDEQLAKKQVDQTLLKKLGWTEDELQRFVDRWKTLKASAAGEGEAAIEAKQELDDTLRNLLPRSNGPLKFRGQAKADDLRANDALRVKPPSEYADRVREYTKGISSQRKD